MIRVVGLFVFVALVVTSLAAVSFAQDPASTPLQETIELQHRGNLVQILELPSGVYLARLSPVGEHKRYYYPADCVEPNQQAGFLFFPCRAHTFYSTTWETGYTVDCVDEHLANLAEYRRDLANWQTARYNYREWQRTGVGFEPPDPGDAPEEPEWECSSRSIRYVIPQTSGRIMGQDFGVVSLPISTDLLLRVGEGGLSPNKQVLHISGYNSWTLTIQPVEFGTRAG